MDRKVQLEVDGQESTEIEVEGTLKAMIVETKKEIELVIESSLGYIIFRDKIQPGVHYIVPTVLTYGDPYRALTPFPTEFHLNEKILILALAKQPTKIGIIFRLA